MRALVLLSLLVVTACGSEESTTDTSGAGGNTGGATGTGGSGGAGHPCGEPGLGCGFGRICVEFNASAGPMTTTTYECHENPCTGDLDCSCAGQICEAKFNIELCSLGGNNDASISCDNGAVCAAPDTPIATPDGERPIHSLTAGDLVLSRHRGELAAVPIERVVSRRVQGHAVVAVTLDNGATLHISGPHPTADGRLFSDLHPGAALGEAVVTSVATVPYGASHTWDILPASDSGTYVAGGALIGSTLR